MKKGKAKKKGNRKNCGKRGDTLCWSCGRSTGGKGCPWADKLEPVEGWTATKTAIKYFWGDNESYVVHKCPLFIEG